MPVVSGFVFLCMFGVVHLGIIRFILLSYGSCLGFFLIKGEHEDVIFKLISFVSPFLNILSNNKVACKISCKEEIRKSYNFVTV